jgi:glycerol-3-phosphate acyltransferase PlsY
MTTVYLLHLAAFFIGGIPFGYILAKSRGVDIRSEGSGNIGATNVHRVVGKLPGILTLIADASKGAACVLLAFFVPENGAMLNPGSYAASLGFVGIVGHCYSPFLKFKGGKGVATSLGAFSILTPVPAIISVILFVVFIKAFRLVALASIAAAVSLPVNYYLLAQDGRNGMLMLMSVLTAALITSRHRENIYRMRAGVEPTTGSNIEDA